MSSEPAVYDYSDYRLYLGDWYVFAKANRVSFSFRNFSRKAGFGSPNFLKRIIDGERNLTVESARKCAEAMGLKRGDQEYFVILVEYTQAKIPKEKQKFYQKMVRSQKFGRLKPTEKNRYAFYSDWLHSVIRELIQSPDFDGKISWLADNIEPSPSLSRVQESLNLMETLGFIKKELDGRYTQTQPLLTTGPESDSPMILAYHLKLLELIHKKVGETPQERRDVSAMTLGTTRAKVAVIKKKIQEFRAELLKLVANDDKPEEVLLLSMYLMPVTKA